MLGADRFDGIHLLGGGVVAGGSGADFGEDLESHVPAGLGPFVVLLHEHVAGEADDGVAAREDADEVGPAAQLAVEALLGYLEA